jgi:integrase
MLRFKKCMEEYRVPTTQLKNRHHPLYPAFLLMLTTGCRRGEILGLTWKNVHLDEGYVSIRQHLIVTSKGLMPETPKTNNSIRDIPLYTRIYGNGLCSSFIRYEEKSHQKMNDIINKHA